MKNKNKQLKNEKSEQKDKTINNIKHKTTKNNATMKQIKK